MVNKTFQKYIQEISTLAIRCCGDEFSKRISDFRGERERILNNIWKKDLLPDDIPLYNKERVFRDIDFDTIIHHAQKYLDMSEYFIFLFEVSEISIKFGELERGERLLKFLSENHRKFHSKDLWARVDKNLGSVTFYRNDFKTANRHFNKSLQLYTELKDYRGIACIKNALGASLVEQGKLNDGEKLFKEARDIAEAEKFSEYLAKTNMNLGNIYQMNGDYNSAITCYMDALKVVDLEQEKDTVAPIYNNIGLAYKCKGEYSTALEYMDKALALSKETNNQYTKAFSYLFQSEVYCYEGDFSKSAALVTSAFSIFSEIGDRLSMAEAYKIFGMINRDSNRPEIAVSYFENCIRINERYKSDTNIAEAEIELAKLYKGTGEKGKAKKALMRAMKKYEKIGAGRKVKTINKAIDELSD